jgi:hypothetical protein
VAGEGMGVSEVQREAELGDAGLWGGAAGRAGVHGHRATGIGCGAWRDGGPSAANLPDIVWGIMGGSRIGGMRLSRLLGLESWDDGARRCRWKEPPRLEGTTHLWASGIAGCGS